jgi:aminoglycoside phosphotransferase (APT) family kinase protein
MTQDLKVRLFQARPAVERYAEQVLRKPLNWGTSLIRIVSPDHNSKSLLYFITVDSKPPAVVQAFSNPSECDELARALKLREKNDIPIPRLLEKGSGLIDRARFGYSFVAMEWMPGEALKPGVPNQNVRDALASSLARLHRVKEKKWGAPGNLRRGSIREDWYRTITAKLQELHGGLQGLDRNLATLVDRWFRETLSSIAEPEEFNLTHGNLRPSSVLYDRERGASLVDCAAMRFARASCDLAQLRTTFFEREDSAWTDLLNRYYAHFPKTEREAIDKETRLMVAFDCLTQLKRRIYSSPEDEAKLDRLLHAIDLSHKQ